jgi:hypothetical protein
MALRRNVFFSSISPPTPTSVGGSGAGSITWSLA